jgi:ribonuclease Z
MVPKPPPREGQMGFLFIPPYRIQGVSVAGEEAVVHVPELDLAFDVGLCPRPVLTAGTVCLSHAHMDHVAALPYWFSQRNFQKLGTGRVLCHPRLVKPLEAMMATWVDLERQKTPHEIVGLEPGVDFQIRPNVFVRGIEVSHSAPSLGFVVLERRSKLKDEFHGLPQDRLRDLKAAGTEITRMMEIPLIAYTGDTEMGPFLLRDEFVNAQIVITECTFFDPEHRDRAKVGKHLHVEDIRNLIQTWKAPNIVVVHVSRRTNMSYARERLMEAAGEHAERVHLLMDHRTNRQRYERQSAADAAAHGASSPAETPQSPHS